MIDNTRNLVPADHPVRAVFQQLTARGMSQLNVRDEETIRYVANLLTDFVQFDNFYRVRDNFGKRAEYICDILEQANLEESSQLRREYHRYLGDWTMFVLGFFPEMLTYGRRTVSPGYYAAQGSRSYSIVADMDARDLEAAVVFRKLSREFSRCVEGLNWVKVYVNDPFYQYMFREFQVTQGD